MAKGLSKELRKIDSYLKDRTISSLDEFLRVFDHISRSIGHAGIYRGTTDEDYTLTPKVGRPERKLKPGPDGRPIPMPYRLTDERDAIAQFRREAAFFLPGRSATQIEWMALAQHYGAPTRLLDWTESFAIATWFAIQQGPRARQVRGKIVPIRPAVWIVPHPSPISRKEASKVFDLGSIRMYRPERFDGRLRNQQSVFTVHPQPNLPWKPLGGRQIAIDPKLLFVLSKRLNSLGINQLQMFPDLAGVGRHVDWLYRNNWLIREGNKVD